MSTIQRALLRMAAAQTCRAVGFDGITDTAADTLTDILEKYLEEAGHSSRELAELGGRTEANLYDVESAIFDLGQSVRNVSRDASKFERIVFERQVPEFPVRKGNKYVPPVTVLNEQPKEREAHVPSFLPPFPEEHTYKQSAVFDKNDDDPQKMKRLNNQRRKAELALVGLGKVSDEKGEDGKAGGKGASADPWSKDFVVAGTETKRLKATELVPVTNMIRHTQVHPNGSTPYTGNMDTEADLARKRAKIDTILNHKHGGMEDDEDEAAE